MKNSTQIIQFGTILSSDIKKGLLVTHLAFFFLFKPFSVLPLLPVFITKEVMFLLAIVSIRVILSVNMFLMNSDKRGSC